MSFYRILLYIFLFSKLSNKLGKISHFGYLMYNNTLYPTVQLLIFVYHILFTGFRFVIVMTTFFNKSVACYQLKTFNKLHKYDFVVIVEQHCFNFNLLL